ncbi:MAG: desulfoferrodoxin [bacterium]
MTELNQIYKCEVCWNIVEMVHTGAGKLVCCGQPMKLMEEKTEEQGYEKHLPVVETADDGIMVKVGSVPHPMEEKHYIEWIEIITNDKVLRRHLKPGDAPEVKFYIKEGIIKVREFCNIHLLWATKM